MQEVGLLGYRAEKKVPDVYACHFQLKILSYFTYATD